jgi:hypothetical protein
MASLWHRHLAWQHGQQNSSAWRISSPDVASHDSLLLAMVEKPKTEVHTDNGLPSSVLSGRVSHSNFRDRRVPYLRKLSTVWIWQHDKRTYDYKIILNCVRKLMKNKSEKEDGKAQTFILK